MGPSFSPIPALYADCESRAVAAVMVAAETDAIQSARSEPVSSSLKSLGPFQFVSDKRLPLLAAFECNYDTNDKNLLVLIGWSIKIYHANLDTD